MIVALSTSLLYAAASPAVVLYQSTSTHPLETNVAADVPYDTVPSKFIDDALPLIPTTISSFR